jgi:hypothetical protein
MRAFYDGDGYPPMGLYFKFFDVAVSLPPHEFKLAQGLTSGMVVYYDLWRHRKVDHNAEAEIGVMIFPDL